MPGDPEDLQARCEQLTLLYQVSNVIHSTLEPQKALDLILREAVRLTRASSGSIVLLNPNSGLLEIEAIHGLPPDAARLRLRVGEGITGWVARTGQSARVDDVQSDPRYIMVRPDVRSELAVPLDVNGETRGVINVDATRRQAFRAADQELLQELAVQAARVIHNTWLYEQVRLKARLFETLSSIGQAVNSALNLGDTLTVITREACKLMEAKMSALLLLDDSGEWLDLRASHGAGPDYLNKPRLAVAESLVGVVVRRRKPMQVENVQVSGRYQNVEIARKEGLVSLLSVPLSFSGQAIGVLNVYKNEQHSFSNEEIGILSALAELSAAAIEKARLYERLVDMEALLRQREKLSALGLLAAEVAHEIRNPLTVLKMLYHSLHLEFPAGDPRARDAQLMGEKMDHLNRVVEKVLDFARTAEPEWHRVSLNALTGDLILLIRHRLSQQQIDLVEEFEPDLPGVRGDATQLEQAFLNLALNAVEAMPRGGRFTIGTRILPPNPESTRAPQVEVWFADTGEGMTEAQQGRVRSSLLNTSKSRGTGLGLAIVARVVEAHHGELRFESSRGRGTTVRVVLPVASE